MNMLETFRLGGIVMYPLLLCSILLLAILIERAFYFIYSSTNNEKLMDAVRWNLKNRGISEATEVARKSRGPVAAVLFTGLTEMRRSDGERLANVIENTIHKEVQKLEERLRLLEIITTISPLLGLLGTVIGIIKNFNILAQTQGLAGPAALSSGIAEALLTTAVGLIIGIAAYVVFSIFDSRIDKFVNNMNDAANFLLEISPSKSSLSSSSDAGL